MPAGVEALFADLGHFSRPAIQLSTYTLLIPSLFLTHSKKGAYIILQSLSSRILLPAAGVEALFADLGHFSRPAIQLSTYTLLIPSLFLTYLGQGAYLVKFPENVRASALLQWDLH